MDKLNTRSFVTWIGDRRQMQHAAAAALKKSTKEGKTERTIVINNDIARQDIWNKVVQPIFIHECRNLSSKRELLKNITKRPTHVNKLTVIVDFIHEDYGEPQVEKYLQDFKELSALVQSYKAYNLRIWYFCPPISSIVELADIVVDATSTSKIRIVTQP